MSLGFKRLIMRELYLHSFTYTMAFAREEFYLMLSAIKTKFAFVLCFSISISHKLYILMVARKAINTLYRTVRVLILYMIKVKVKVSRDRPRWPKGFRVD